MKSKIIWTAVLALAVSLPGSAQAVYDIFDFDEAAEGPWSDIDTTTLTVPKVPDGSVQLDGDISEAEYGGFEGVTVTPGVNAWILAYPAEREWDGPEDNAFTFWLAHDNTYLYVAVEAVDELVNIDNTVDAAWRDDAVEIIVDALNDDFDVNTDSSEDDYGGHCYVTYVGGFSQWDAAAEAKFERIIWAGAVDWTYGPDGEILAGGKEEAPGWKLEVRFAKSLFEVPEVGNKLDDGYEMGFNIGLDDDDLNYFTTAGDPASGGTMEIQYWWANRVRALGFDPAVLVWDVAENASAWYDTMEDLEAAMAEDPNFLENNFDMGINANGRLSHGGAGSIIFAAAVSVEDWSLH